MQNRIHLDTLTYIVYTILRTEAFDSWLSKLKDARGKARIIERIRSAERGNFGDCEPVGAGVSLGNANSLRAWLSGVFYTQW